MILWLRNSSAPELPRPFEGRGRASGAGEGQKSRCFACLSPRPERERMKVRVLVQRAIFPARDSRFCVRIPCPPGLLLKSNPFENLGLRTDTIFRMADVSDIEDGFALKRRRDKARKVGKKRVLVSTSEDTIPPPPAKHILGSFTLANPTSKRAVSDYVETQARDEKVLHAEKIKSEHLFGRDYDCWDVHTNKDRYWVITSPTNLYSQRYFPSLDFTLSFHIGLSARIMERSRGAPDDAQRSAPDYNRPKTTKGLGRCILGAVKCDECLIQLVRSLAKPEMVPPGEDVTARCRTLFRGRINRSRRRLVVIWRVRGHLKATAKSSWDLAQWLTHANSAARHDAVIARRAVVPNSTDNYAPTIPLRPKLEECRGGILSRARNRAL